MIAPTPGRIVLFRPSGSDPTYLQGDDQPRAAIVAHVNPDGTINICTFSEKGSPCAIRNVPLIQDGETPPRTGYAEWMAYQKGQAAKAEALEVKLANTTDRSDAELQKIADVGAQTSASTASSSLQATDAASAAVAIAPRVKLTDIEAAIAARYDLTADRAVFTLVPAHPSLRLLSLCILVMANRFTVIGKSAPASPENFNAELGRKFAYEDAVRQLWPLMGFALRDKLAAA